MRNLNGILLVVLCLPLTAIAQREFLDSLFIVANEHYRSEHYAEAANEFNRILQQGYAHVNLYYNLGNAYYQLGRLGDAIWAYEKGLQLNPRDTDLKFNLKVANARIVDRVEIPEGFFLLEWYGALKRGLSPTQWMSVISFLFLMSAVLFVASRLVSAELQWWLSRVVTVGLLLAFMSLSVFADLYFELSDKNEAIVVVAQENVHSAPVEISNVAFVLHEGTKMKITQEQFPWVEIELIDGKKGWIKADRVRRL